MPLQRFWHPVSAALMMTALSTSVFGLQSGLVFELGCVVAFHRRLDFRLTHIALGDHAVTGCEHVEGFRREGRRRGRLRGRRPRCQAAPIANDPAKMPGSQDMVRVACARS